MSKEQPDEFPKRICPDRIMEVLNRAFEYTIFYMHNVEFAYCEITKRHWLKFDLSAVNPPRIELLNYYMLAYLPCVKYFTSEEGNGDTVIKNLKVYEKEDCNIPKDVAYMLALTQYYRVKEILTSKGITTKMLNEAIKEEFEVKDTKEMTAEHLIELRVHLTPNDLDMFGGQIECHPLDNFPEMSYDEMKNRVHSDVNNILKGGKQPCPLALSMTRRQINPSEFQSLLTYSWEEWEQLA